MADMIAWCREHLARYKCPRHVIFGELPKTSTGKIQKFVLRERAKGVEARGLCLINRCDHAPVAKVPYHTFP